MSVRTIKLDKETVKFYKELHLGRLARSAYEKYKTKWFIDHNYSVVEIFENCYEAAKEIVKDRIAMYESQLIDDVDEILNIDPEDIMAKYEEHPLYEECYVSFDEFTRNEFCDKDIVKELLNEEDYKAYLRIIEEG